MNHDNMTGTLLKASLNFW